MKIFGSHKADNINNADIIVYSSAIKKNNIEILTAKKLKIPVFSRAMMLAQVMRLKASINYGCWFTWKNYYDLFNSLNL